MARQKLSEFRAKKLINPDYSGIELTPTAVLPKLEAKQKYVLKVDQAEKGRFKKGLVKLNLTPADVEKQLIQFQKTGYEYFIVEPMSPHAQSEEKFLSLSYSQGQTTVQYSSLGGVEIEANKAGVVTWSANVAAPEGVPGQVIDFVERLLQLMKEKHIVFIEINPLLVTSDSISSVDCAMEVDGSGQFFVQNAWNHEDTRVPFATSCDEEKSVEALNESSPSSFNLKVLNPNGSLFLLLSGGGASLTLADLMIDVFGAKSIANYGEYSGGPTRLETKQYTSQLLSLLLASQAPKKSLVIGGGVANFTDVSTTFDGIIDAYADRLSELTKHEITVYVRRGGPRQKEGLQKIATYFSSIDVPHFVNGPDVSLHDFVHGNMKGELK